MNKRSGYNHVNKVVRQGGPCACGCGSLVDQPPGSGRPRKYLAGHKTRAQVDPEILCGCGCGEQTVRTAKKGPWPKYITGHNKKPVQPGTPITAPEPDDVSIETN